jgi:hypothetical protein
MIRQNYAEKNELIVTISSIKNHSTTRKGEYSSY